MPAKNPAINELNPSNGDDRAQRVNHLLDCIDAAAKSSVRGLPVRNFEATSIGVQHSSQDEKIALLTITTREGISFRFSFSKNLAKQSGRILSERL